MPLVLATFLWPVDGDWGWKALVSAIEASGGLLVLAQVGGYFGKKKEPSLWASWGGAPTQTMLSHAGKAEKALLTHWHAGLERVTGLKMPTATEEADNPF